ncbi:procathepsin L-like [Argiope bruennichi]|uniref:Cathepsin L like protein n=1 Tax=Argiope bruennichi TaxID=94029 RepID=A0A8T0G151_ARGBR|nr:procathepsin L-like [Argiope bruennichi]KAF8796178.1 Cathepsin L like protein [Argiope bruennichi]
MKLIIFAYLFAACAGASFPFDPELNEYWEHFKKVFNKSYNRYEESARRLIWESNIAEITRHNLDADLGVHSYKRGINMFSDMSKEELSSKANCLKRSGNFLSSGSVWLPPLNADVPDKVDWREKGLVTGVKDQGHCGSCWAFSATGSLEGQHKRKTGNLVSLSEQNLIDCSRAEGNDGCNGGWMDQAFQYVKKNHGIDTEKAYPYVDGEDSCHFKKSGIGATCTGYVDIPSGDEKALMIALATVGPISVAINASGNFMDYDSGIYSPRDCNGGEEDLSHGVLAVGYGSENGKDYWIVKNSWGDSWGEKGYIRMIRNNNNKCGIATKASYPLM